MSVADFSPQLAIVVDDQADNRLIFQIALEMAGYVVTCAINGEQALAILKNQNFHLMILDLDMPVLNGRDLLKILELQALPMPTHILVATANVQMTTAIVKHLADHIIYKPVEVRALIGLAKRLKTDFSSRN